ncbi:MAG: methylated-DNA--[protein]-cysteine S-methyltransferase [Dehalococcoidales bacterium]|nr:methylated-DNA--[protein]-cysteine S-methyltransferase [Dehalococcoidales bacterium]
MTLEDGLYYCVFNTSAGWIGLAGSDDGLVRTTLPLTSKDLAEESLSLGGRLAACAPDRFTALSEKYRRYFAGEKVDFTEGLDISRATPFEKAVWESTVSIPYGETRSYGWVACQIGKPRACRAVGGALVRNPLPIIVPCHRVIASDNTLRGFTGGLEIKRFLLRLEARP